MTRKIAILLVSLVIQAGLGSLCLPSWADVTGRPHDLSIDNDKGHCINCHDLHQVNLGQGYAHNLKRGNEMKVCYQCHAGALNDYSSIDPSLANSASLASHYDILSEFNQPHIHFPRYGMDGEHYKCSYCHNPHGVFNHQSTTRKPKLLSAGPDVVTDTDEYCFVCHNSDPNPPHRPFSNISARPQYKFSRNTYKQMTHSTFFRWSTANEPVPDTAFSYDDNPYGAGKDISCLTCHRPHGSANDHMLKAADNQQFCLSCHDGSPAADLTQFNTTGHGKTGVGRTCQECHFPHGTGQENAVKTIIVDSHTLKNMTTNINSKGMNEACFACHSQGSTPTAYYSFDSSIGGWSSSVSYLTQTRDTATVYSGSGSLKQTTTTSYSSSYSYTDYITVQPGTAYNFYGSLLIPATPTGGAVYVYIQELNAGGGYVTATTSSQWSAATGAWSRKKISFTTNAATSKVRLFLYLTGTGIAYWDEISILGPSEASFYQGKANYNLGIHKTSTNAHNPNDTAGDQAAGECDNCHNPHGKGNQKMMVDIDDQTVCYDCHNATTHNTQSGVDVKAAFQSASHHDLTKVKCINCHNTHLATQSSPTMDPFYPGGVITDKANFCLSCHSGTMPTGVTGAPDISAQWGIGGHNKTNTLICSDCHESHGSPNGKNLNYKRKTSGGYMANFTSGMSFASRAFCEACHNRTGLGYKNAKQIPTGAGYVGQHAQADSTPCSNCHSQKHNPTLTNGTTYYKIACLTCHTQGQGNPYPNTDAEFNTPANGADANTRVSIHDITYTPQTRVDCVKCHGANHETDHSASNMVIDPDPGHGLSGPMPPVATSSVFCLECHDSTPIKLSNYSSPVNIMDTWTTAGHGKRSVSGVVCEACHTHHGATKVKLIKDTINGKPVLNTYTGNNSSVCTACHMSSDLTVPKWSGFTVYSSSIHAFGNMTTGNMVSDGRHGKGVCVNCHNPHGARVAGQTAPSMLYKSGENLCYRCHASGFDNFSTPGDYNNKWDQFGTFVRIAKENDTAQTGQNKMALHLGQAGGQSVPNLNGGTFYEGLLSSNAFKDMSGVVVTAKVKIPVLTQPAGYIRPGIVTIEDAANPPKPWPSTNAPPYVFCTYNGTNWVVWAASGNPPVDTNMGSVAGSASSYRTIKFVRSKLSSGKVYVYVDSTFIVSAPFVPKSGYFKVRLSSQGSTTATGSAMEAWYDDFGVQYPNGGSAHNTTSGDDVQARFYMKSHHTVSATDQLGPDGVAGTADDSKVECTDCHDPHIITEKLMAFKEISDTGGRRVLPEVADQKFCVKCHSAKPPAGVKYPAAGVWNKYNYISSAHGNRLFRKSVFNLYTAGIACKVCHNPHGSNQAHLQRDSWDINRDGIPDDIDGDGILDSSDMVGYVGYTSDQSNHIVYPRRVILVQTKGNITSRASFQRVSTTIPRQANGTIDVELCLVCHDGSPAYDVRTDVNKKSHHPVEYSQQVALGGAKIYCYSCHDQHRAQATDEANHRYATTNPECNADNPLSNREPMESDAAFCLKCHDNVPPAGISFGSLTGAHRLKNIKLSYNPRNHLNSHGYDVITTNIGHFVQSTGAAMMCRDCHNQHGSNYDRMLRDNTEPSKPGYDSTQPVQNMQPVALSPSDPYSGGDNLPLTSTAERCLACHGGVTTYKGNHIPLPPPPSSYFIGFSSLPEVGKHPDIKGGMTVGNGKLQVRNGHLYSDNTFAVSTSSLSPASVKDTCILCHDSHSPYIGTVDEQLMNCYQCHNENTSLPDVQSEFNDNPTNPTRSQSIHPIKFDPTGTTPYYVECLKCHDQSKHMQGSVRLKKDPTQLTNNTDDATVWTNPVSNRTINQFCLECHAPGTTVASSFWRGGTEHVPPKLPSGHLDGSHFVNGTLLCTDCHEYHGSRNKGLRKNARGDSETFCYSCHSSPANSQNGINIQAKFASASRHQISQADQAANKSKVECEDCHNPHVVTRTNPVVRMPNVTTAAASDNAFCIGCHDANGAPGVRFPGYTTGVSAPEWDTATGKWNKWDKSAYTGSDHDSKGALLCKSCHDPHGSPNYTLLLTNVTCVSGSGKNIAVSFGVHSTSRGKRKEEIGVNGICAGCHKKPVGVYNFANYSVGSYPGYASYTGMTFGRKSGVDKNCTYCHNPHGTAQPKLMRSNKTLYMNMTSKSFGGVYNFKGFQNKTTGGPYYAFCSSRGCHASERTQLDTFNQELPVDNFTNDVTASSHHPVKEGVIGCTSCHREHGSGYAPDLRAAYFRESNWPKLWHSGRGVYPASGTLQHGGGCGQAQPYDKSDYFEMAKAGYSPGWPVDPTHRNQVTTVNPPANANDLCYMCHQMDDIIGTAANGMTGTNTKFLGHEAVKGGALISRNISRDGNGVGSDYHNFSCSTCHFPHSSSMGKLLKQGCMSQADATQDPNINYATINSCHSYKKAWYGSWRGWRNLTTASKTDFKRPPNAVTNLSISQDADLTVHLSWTAVADVPGQGAHHYNVYRSSQSITQDSMPAATRIYKGVAGGSPGAAVGYDDLTGQPNTTYYYVVVACDLANNESLVSNCVKATLGPDTFVPNAISDQATAQADGTYNVKLTWHDPGDNVNVTQYKIHKKPDTTTPLTSGEISGGTYYLATVTDTSLSADGSPDTNLYSYTDQTTQFGHSYSYAVVAQDAAGLGAAAVPTGTSPFYATIVDPAPAAVTTLNAKPVSLQTQAQLNWSTPTNVGAVSGYNVYRKAGSALAQSELVPGNRVNPSPGSVAFLGYTAPVPTIGTDYYFTVTAIDSSSGKESKLGNNMLVNVPVPPAGMTATKLLKSQVQLGWTAPAYTTGLGYYKVYARRSPGDWVQMNPVDNIVVNPSFDYDLTNWSSGNLTVVRDSVNYYDGVGCVKLTSASAGDRYLQSGNMPAVSPSTSYVYSGYVNVPVPLTGGTTALRIIEYDASNNYITEHMASGVSTTAGWQKLTDTWTTNAMTAKVYLRIQLSGVGTAYWDNLSLAPSNILSTNAKIDFTGFEPGNYEIAATANYGTYGGSTPYESIRSAAATLTFTDTVASNSVAATGALTPASNYTVVNLGWSTPADLNFSGYTPSGLSYYRVQATYDQGATWNTIIRSRLSNPSFEAFSGTPDDASADSFTGWNSNYTNMYCVTDSLYDSKAVKIRYTGTSDYYTTYGYGYIYSSVSGTSVSGSTHSMSFWAKASKSTTFQYYIMAGSEKIGLTTASIGTDWQRFTATGTFSSGNTNTSVSAYIRPSSDTTADVTVDCVRLDTSTTATLANDGSFLQPTGGSQSFDDPNALTAGTSARYRIQTVDNYGNFSAASVTSLIPAKPAAVSDLTVTSSQTSSANVLTFSTPMNVAGIARYDVYAKNQTPPLSSLTDATKIGTITPGYPYGGNVAPLATPSANYTYDVNYYSVTNVIDGNTGTYWYGQSGVGDNYLTLNFGSSNVPVYKVSLYFYPSSSYCPKNYLIQTYDGANWVTQVTVTNNSSSSVSYTLPVPVTTSQVRIYITDTWGGIASYFPIIGEFMVYPGATYTHNLQNGAMKALAGQSYAYAVIAVDSNTHVSDISGGPVTVKTVLDKDGPATVGDLSVTSPIGSTQVALKWSTPQDNLGFGSTGATNYEVYRLPTGLAGTPTAVTDANLGTASLVYSGTYASSVAGTQNSYTATWYDHQGVYYAVRSRDAAGNWSLVSNSPSIIVGKDIQAPSPPTITDCIPVTSPEMDVYWSPAVDNIGVNGYRLFRANVNTAPFSNDSCITVNNVGSADVAVNLIGYDRTDIADTGGTPGNTYYYALRAWDDEGNMSNISNCAIATVATTSSDSVAPTWSGTPLTVLQQPYPDIDLIWTPATDVDNLQHAGTIDHYDIYRGPTSFNYTTDPGVTKIATVSGIRHSYIDNTGAHDTTYYYRLVAVDASPAHNSSALSNIASAMVAARPSPDNTKPTVPGSLQASTGIYPAINLSWAVSTDVDDAGVSQQLLYYKLYRSLYPLDITDLNKNNHDQVDTIIIANDANQYNMNGIGGTQYNFRLEAFDLAGNSSGLSNQVAGQVAPAPCVDTTVPSAPANLAATIGPSPDIELSWTASADSGSCAGQIDHYVLYKANYAILSDTPLSSLTHVYIAGNNTAFTDSSGAPNTQYWYVLTAVDSSRNESLRSNIITRTTAADTMAPASISDLKATLTGGKVVLTWCRPSDNVGVSHYDIYRKEQSTIMTDADIAPANKIATFVNGGTCLSYSDDTAATSGHTYSYAIIAVDAAGNRATISRGEHDGDTVYNPQ